MQRMRNLQEKLLENNILRVVPKELSIDEIKETEGKTWQKQKIR